MRKNERDTSADLILSGARKQISDQSKPFVSLIFTTFFVFLYFAPPFFFLFQLEGNKEVYEKLKKRLENRVERVCLWVRGS